MLILWMIVSFFLPITGKANQSSNGNENVVVSGNNNQILLNRFKKDKEIVIPKAVHGDLKVPEDAVLLERSHLMAKLKEAFSNSNDITTVTLIGIVGIGGVGKTTLARLWGKRRIKEDPKLHVWEFNAETPLSLSNSMKAFAGALAQTREQKEQLQGIEHVQGSHEQEKRRLEFVQSRLKESKGWVLIYDNAETYQDMEAYLPRDSHVWGKGQVLVTTRNSHILNSKESKLTLEELTPDEALTLFVRLRFKREPGTLSVKQQQETMEFLTHLPPFPLDISIAAKYIATYNVSYKTYLAQLKEQDPIFHETQYGLLKESGTYTKTRYEIITLSLKRIMEQNPVFTELLLMMSLLDSQDIPKDMFSAYTASPAVADRFIHELLKSSLITSQSMIGDLPVFSIHRSTRELCYAHLVQSLRLKPQHPLVDAVTRKMADFVYDAIDHSMRLMCRLLEPHGKRILQSELLTTQSKMKIMGMVGCIEYYLGKGTEAQELLETSITYVKRNMPRNKLRLGRLLMHLGMVYRLNSDYVNAEKYLLESIDDYKRARNLTGQINALTALGHLYYVVGDYIKAKNILEYTIKPDLNPRTNPTSFIIRKRVQHLIESELGEYNTALNSLTEAMQIMKQNEIKDDRYATYLSSLGLLHSELGQYTKAKHLLDESIETHKEYDSKTIYFWKLIGYQASTYCKLGNYQQAEAMLESVLYFYQQNAKENALDIGYAQTLLAKLYRKQGLLGKAKECCEEAERLYLKIFGEKSLRTSWVRMTLGQIYVDLGEYQKAKDILNQCLIDHRGMLKDTHPKIGKILIYLGYAQLKLGDINQGVGMLHLGLENYQNHYGQGHIRTAEALRLIGEGYMLQRKMDEGEEALRYALKICKSNDHPDAHMCLERLAEIYRQKTKEAEKAGNTLCAGEHLDEAKEYLIEALAIAEKALPKDSVYIQRIQKTLKL
jgi:tetratricopeptide (TPR) repeat protein